MYTYHVAYIKRYLCVCVWGGENSKVHLSAVCCCCDSSTVLLQARWLLFAPGATRVVHKNYTLTQIRSRDEHGDDPQTDGRTDHRAVPCCAVLSCAVPWWEPICRRVTVKVFPTTTTCSVNSSDCLPLKENKKDPPPTKTHRGHTVPGTVTP